MCYNDLDSLYTGRFPPPVPLAAVLVVLSLGFLVSDVYCRWYPLYRWMRRRSPRVLRLMSCVPFSIFLYLVVDPTAFKSMKNAGAIRLLWMSYKVLFLEIVQQSPPPSQTFLRSPALFALDKMPDLDGPSNSALNVAAPFAIFTLSVVLVVLVNMIISRLPGAYRCAPFEQNAADNLGSTKFESPLKKIFNVIFPWNNSRVNELSPPAMISSPKAADVVETTSLSNPPTREPSGQKTGDITIDAISVINHLVAVFSMQKGPMTDKNAKKPVIEMFYDKKLPPGNRESKMQEVKSTDTSMIKFEKQPKSYTSRLKEKFSAEATMVLGQRGENQPLKTFLVSELQQLPANSSEWSGIKVVSWFRSRSHESWARRRAAQGKQLHICPICHRACNVRDHDCLIVVA